MTLPAPNIQRYTPEEYLALELTAEVKSEYFDGYIYAMSGGTPDHSRLKVDLGWLVRTQLREERCELFDSDLMVKVDRFGYVYPDLSVVCGESLFEGNALLNPTAMFEVLSPSTELHDRSRKWKRYRRMPSLRQYVLVNPDEPLIEVFTREGDMWTFSDAEGLDASIHLESINCMLALSDVYRRIVFEPPAAEEEATIL